MYIAMNRFKVVKGSRLCKNARWAAPCDEVLGLDCFVASIFGLAVFGG
jgi:hypothetical protein